MRVIVIVDKLRADRRRRCFWEECLSSFPDTQVELVTLNRRITTEKFSNILTYDIIIFNWDVLNHDIVFGADSGHIFVKNNRDDFVQFVRRGGIVIMEDQSKYWLPVQDAYNTLLSNQISVFKSTLMEYLKSPVSASAHINKRFKKHPLLQGLPSILSSDYAHPSEYEWFPTNSVAPRVLEKLHPTKIYSGAFQKWETEWLPLLYTADGKYPIMLVKTDGLGLWVTSTMFLASANIKILTENLILKAKDHLFAIRQYHSRHRAARVVYAFSAMLHAYWISLRHRLCKMLSSWKK